MQRIEEALTLAPHEVVVLMAEAYEADQVFVRIRE